MSHAALSGGVFGARSPVTGSQNNSREAAVAYARSNAAVTTPAPMAGACTRCGATVASGSAACPRCGSAITGSHPAEQAERIRLRIQESIGDAYRLVELLGRGGMGIVFRAREVALDREVALKVLTLDPMLSPEAYARFEREAKLAARLDHPNVVPIFAVGQRNTVAYYTMRLVRGGTVEDLLANHRALDFQHALEILREVARALDYAHGQGVVHRDIKPANILIGDSGHIMVSDFGIARGLGMGDTTLGSGAVIGSPGYMAPEQWRGEEIDARADQYALGVVAFEMLTGHRPFETVRVQDLMKLHLSADVPNASSVKPVLPPFVDLSIRRAMSKVRGERFTSAAAFVDSLAGKRPVSGLTRTSVRMAARTEEPVAESGSGRMMLYIVVAFVILAAVVIAGTIVIERRMELTKPQPIVSPAPSTVAATPDSLSTTDTTFDVNRPAAPAAAAAPAVAREPVSADRTLFPARNRIPAPDAPGYVRVLARGGTARVRVDGRMYGFSPLIVRVGPGAHVVSLESSGDAFLPAQISVSVVSNDTVAAIFAARVSPPDGQAHDTDRQPLAAPPVSGTTPVGAAPDHQTDGSGAGAPASPPPSSSGEPTPP
jgi:Protein kinase domain